MPKAPAWPWSPAEPVRDPGGSGRWIKLNYEFESESVVEEAGALITYEDHAGAIKLRDH